MADENKLNDGPSDPSLPGAGFVQASTERDFQPDDAVAETGDCAPLLSDDEKQNLKNQWDAIQTGFVDEPRQAVARADVLVAGAIRRLGEIFSDERAQLEGQWDRGDDVSTEELRVAMQRYRAFFGRLLSI